MSQFCSRGCEQNGSICDFCKFYNFNGDENGAYTGNGWCRKLKVHKDPEEGYKCEEFVCFLIGDF